MSTSAAGANQVQRACIIFPTDIIPRTRAARGVVNNNKPTTSGGCCSKAATFPTDVIPRTPGGSSNHEPHRTQPQGVMAGLPKGQSLTGTDFFGVHMYKTYTRQPSYPDTDFHPSHRVTPLQRKIQGAICSARISSDSILAVDVSSRRRGEMNAVNVATALHRFAKHSVREHRSRIGVHNVRVLKRYAHTLKSTK